MEFSELKELLEQFDASSIRVFDLKDSDFHLLLSKDKVEAPSQTSTPMVPPIKEVVTESDKTVQEVMVEEVVTDLTNTKEGQLVTSPLVGVTYLSPSPDQAVFKQVGDKVAKGEVLCIVEAMKVMNEIVSDLEGTILEILIENEEVVEFGQPLFRIS